MREYAKCIGNCLSGCVVVVGWGEAIEQTFQQIVWTCDYNKNCKVSIYHKSLTFVFTIITMVQAAKPTYGAEVQVPSTKGHEPVESLSPIHRRTETEAELIVSQLQRQLRSPVSHANTLPGGTEARAKDRSPVVCPKTQATATEKQGMPLCKSLMTRQEGFYLKQKSRPDQECQGEPSGMLGGDARWGHGAEESYVFLLLSSRYVAHQQEHQLRDPTRQFNSSQSIYLHHSKNKE